MVIVLLEVLSSNNHSTTNECLRGTFYLWFMCQPQVACPVPVPVWIQSTVGKELLSLNPIYCIPNILTQWFLLIWVWVEVKCTETFRKGYRALVCCSCSVPTKVLRACLQRVHHLGHPGGGRRSRSEVLQVFLPFPYVCFVQMRLSSKIVCWLAACECQRV